MNILELFAQQHVHDVLQSTFSYSDGTEILFSIDECNENFVTLNVKTDGVLQNYVLLKIPEYLKTTEHPQLKNPKVLNPLFVIENINEECYGAFEYQPGIENFVAPERNNIECLKNILQNLAEHQALIINSEKVNTTSEYDLQHISSAVTSFDFFKDLDTVLIKNSIEYLQAALNKLLKGTNFFVRSIWCPFGNNVFVNQNIDKSIFFIASSIEVVPPAYDALLYIFALSDEKFRQEYFENLVLFYFESLKEFLHKLQSRTADEITRRYSEHQVQVLLPIIKFKIASSLFESENTSKHQDLLTNLVYLLKYPLINQEDIYEATKNKIGSRYYDLLDYTLVCLSEKNGHLGEYYHLVVKIKTKENEQELELFAKILNPSSEMTKDLVDNGLAQKEDFFYNTFIPLCSKHGLDSLLDFAPRCYLNRVHWVLVLDDLSRQGYVALKPNVTLNYDGLKASIENLAKFHACAIILEEILSEKSEKIVRLDQDYGELLKESMLIYGENSFLTEIYDKTLQLNYYILEKFPEITKQLNSSPEEIKARLKATYLSLFSKVKKSDTIRNVINHGDLYVGNMLFKFGEDKLIKNGILIDFQILRYCSPNYDLLFFLFENSTKETRDKYLKTLIEDYYRFISENIKKFDYDPEVIFPKKSFDDNINHMKSAGIIGALNYIHMMHLDPDLREEIMHDQDKTNYYLVQHPTELLELSFKGEHYRTILRGLVEDLVEVIRNEF